MVGKVTRRKGNNKQDEENARTRERKRKEELQKVQEKARSDMIATVEPALPQGTSPKRTNKVIIPIGPKGWTFLTSSPKNTHGTLGRKRVGTPIRIIVNPQKRLMDLTDSKAAKP